MRWLAALLSLLLVSCGLQAEEIHVAAASDLNFAIKEIIQPFEQNSGHRVRLTLGSSGNIYAQITNGAPFDIFLSADVNYPRLLERAGRAVEGSTFIYGIGRIALWIPRRTGMKLETLGMKALVDPSLKKIAIANPEHAPYGQAAVAAMRKAGIYEQVKEKLVLGENISQAAQFVQSGAADIGIVALSLAVSEPMRQSGLYWPIPQESYPPLQQGAVLLKRAGPAAKAFYEWLRRPEARRVFEKYGFGKV